MAETPALAELGFAEFTAKLISGVFDAVVTAQLEQEKSVAGLVAAAQLSLDEFARRFVTDEQTAAELVRLFPGASEKSPTSIYPGAPYQPAAKGVAEEPPVADVLGLRLGRGDYVTRRRQTTLTARGVDRITAVVRTRLALEQSAAVQEIARRGVPRVVADAGRVNSKLTYSVISTEEAAASARASAPIGATPSVAAAVGLPQAGALAKLRLMVRPADERAPQNQKLQVNVFGEVEISFKTIS